MRVIRAFPPNFSAISKAFPHIRGQRVIFCYGNTIFNPTGITVGHELHVHESVHSRRQDNNPDGWWKRYLEDAKFRLDEEIPAHQAEFQVIGAFDKHALRKVAERLCSPLYGGLVRLDEAMRLIGEAPSWPQAM